MSSENSPDTAPWLPNPAWRLEVLNGVLVASAGADEVYLVDEAPAAGFDRLLDLCRTGQARLWQHDAALGAAIRQLRRLGVLLPAGALPAGALLPGDRPAVALRWAGQPLPGLRAALQSHGWTCLPDGGDVPTGALTLLVRTTANWSELLAAYDHTVLPGVHVLLDLAYHHTVGIGPLVVPGHTACLACMGHRILQRWGDLPMPATPAMLQRVAGVAALLADAAVLGPRLVERACTLDLRSLRLDSSHVFAQPDCPVCTQSIQAGAHSAPLPLPWLFSDK